MKASDLFVKSLEKEDVEYIFGIPGEENLDFLESLRNSKIKLILTRHEQAAGFMAATYGRLTGKVGVCLSTLGPGVTNFITAAAYAQLGAMPILMISGQKPIKKSKQGRFQILNVVEIMRPITKFTRQIVHGNNIPVAVREAIRLAQEERPGAVHLELPEDIAAEDCTSQPLEIIESRRPFSDSKIVDQAVEMIRKATRPLLLIGAAANRNRTCKALAKLVDKSGLYFFNTQMGKGVIDERHPKYLGTAALSTQDYIHCAIDRADLIINVGHDVIEKPPFFMEVGGAQVIHINNFAAQVDEVYFPQLNLVGDIAHSIQQISKKLKPSPNWNFSYFERVKNEIEAHIELKSADDHCPVIPQYLVSQVRKVMPDDGVIALDNGVYKIWFARNYKAYKPNTVLLDNALATMGAGFPSAMAAKIVNPKKKVMAICGDGGFMMNSQEMETAVRLKLDIVILILRDDAYGMIKWKQAGMGFPYFGLDYGNPDFVEYARSYGAEGHRITSSAELATTMDKCLKSKGVHLIEVPVDYTENERFLTEELNSRICLL
ncbi:MAG: acetolactate synthase large subunit [Candidatus Nitrohelix vancouverensis]|uniref:Acetolactate synthase large subunit n=1 Tax=Candidatus Nitrohelix vancouverensis TaxID=2705534 RepID=A0A7T0C4D0_9BACT|nr:MAG: acetolactate synthase large subunit [Candidatus Nitrohelix vancouverensis]